MTNFNPDIPRCLRETSPGLLSHPLSAGWCHSNLSSEERLERILSDKIMRFNPYLVDDQTLLDCAARGRMQPLPSLTQMMIYHFLDIKYVRRNFIYEAIFYRIGNSPEVFHTSLSSLISSISHYCHKGPVHSKFNSSNLTNDSMVEKMQNRSFFVSNVILGTRNFNTLGLGYRFHRMKGNDHSQADTIRRSMCNAKIEMLNEMIEYPWSDCLLKISSNVPDYTHILLHAIDIVKSFPKFQGHLPSLSELTI